jgi:hypothetical protein
VRKSIVRFLSLAALCSLALSLPAPAQTAPATGNPAVPPATSPSAAAKDFPKAYLAYFTYAGGKLEVAPVDKVEIKNVYGGSVKTAAGKDLTYQSKMVVALICLDSALYDTLAKVMETANGTYLRGKVIEADVAGASSDLESLKSQKQVLDRVIQTNNLTAQLGKVADELGAAITRAEETVRNAPPVTVAPRDKEFTFVTLSGKTYSKVRVSGVSDQGVNLLMENGLGRVPLEDIPAGASVFPEPWRLEINQMVESKRLKAEAVQKAAEEAAAKKAAEEAAKNAPPATEAAPAPAPAATPAPAPAANPVPAPAGS